MTQLKSILKKNQNTFRKKRSKNVSFSNYNQYKLIPNRFELDDISDILILEPVAFCFNYFILFILLFIIALLFYNNYRKKYNYNNKLTTMITTSDKITSIP